MKNNWVGTQYCTYIMYKSLLQRHDYTEAIDTHVRFWVPFWKQGCMYWAAEGGERPCNAYIPNVQGEIQTWPLVSKFRTTVYGNGTMTFIINRKCCVNFASYALMSLIMSCLNITITMFLPNTVLLSLTIWISPYTLLTCPLATFGSSICPCWKAMSILLGTTPWPTGFHSNVTRFILTTYSSTDLLWAYHLQYDFKCHHVLNAFNLHMQYKSWVNTCH